MQGPLTKGCGGVGAGPVQMRKSGSVLEQVCRHKVLQETRDLAGRRGQGPPSHFLAPTRWHNDFYIQKAVSV